MLEAHGIACVRGNRRLFAGLSFRLEPRCALRVLGENGAGKTSLLRIVAGLSPAESGELRWNGTPVAVLGEDYRREIAYLGHANALKDDLTALENLDHALALAGIGAGRDAMRGELERLGLGGAMQLPAKLLSQGQKRRAALARLAFCGERVLWILDEPFAALDVEAVARLAHALAAHLGRGGMLLFTTHQEVDLPGAAVAGLGLDGRGAGIGAAA
ncbi:MAG TPA: cytochrome c biogenesis heme-transporting ATPase CcmA [Burkholderiales bacterium]|nr:cytochrome c biogenesis heme-transporting ATPase CcmA [Burkholderiales bacterium]